MNIALLTAGGSGNRMGQDIPKQFMCIDNKPVIIYTLQAFQYCPKVDAIAVVCLPGWNVFLQAYANQYNLTKLKWIFDGADSNQGSIKKGI
ncbi:MAG: 2-C-methyl-D-erythritol 4-phosphate cytidylyltransferase, partial [Lachnospiraceae bacterium]|nr:2-C-methyl-D-erythritol 4-phosphate cytidylyltransferase [Lachnospiraceae bacterium]